MKNFITYRDATIDDAETIFAFIQELAEYEKLSHEVVASVDDLKRTMFGEKSYAFAVLAELEGEAVGVAICFYNYSTFQCKPGIYLEDLYVQEAHRNKGIGKGFFKYLAERAVREDCGRIQWWVLDWNEPSIEFYKKLGAVAMDEWTVFRVEGEQIKTLVETL
ncbi:MAG: GNAT family N-acetyltransferase [Micavibrio sp.]|nr:GNAT family N-acetyltransferase [Micavibrio sp.]|tara:strand:+ start:577 stop:1065 length:489 start_codon:yes stop_codon:yes gene_type:complete